MYTYTPIRKELVLYTGLIVKYVIKYTPLSYFSLIKALISKLDRTIDTRELSIKILYTPRLPFSFNSHTGINYMAIIVRM